MGLTLAQLAAQVTQVKNDLNGVSNRVASLQSSVSSLQSATNASVGRLAALETRTHYLSVSGTDTLLNGAGKTESTNGLVNIIVGYSEANNDTRTGSHNLVVGRYHSYSSFPVVERPSD